MWGLVIYGYIKDEYGGGYSKGRGGGGYSGGRRCEDEEYWDGGCGGKGTEKQTQKNNKSTIKFRKKIIPIYFLEIYFNIIKI